MVYSNVPREYRKMKVSVHVSRHSFDNSLRYLRLRDSTENALSGVSPLKNVKTSFCLLGEYYKIKANENNNGVQ